MAREISRQVASPEEARAINGLGIVRGEFRGGEPLVTMTEADLLTLFERCSNAGRWGADDELGTLNFITAERRVAAARQIVTGDVVALGRPLGRGLGDSVVHRMLLQAYEDSYAAMDTVEISPHGFVVTHLDAIGHVAFRGQLYNNRRAADAVTAEGLKFGSIARVAGGIFTRGVLLDIALARGVDWLRPGDVVTVADLEAAEERTGTRVASGDAVFVRVGLGAREAREGLENPIYRAGLGPDCIPWLFEREIALYSGDCVEQLPSPYPRVVLPLHMVGLTAMGLTILDHPDIEPLANACQRLGRFEFAVACAPLRIEGGTGSAVNPFCLF